MKTKFLLKTILLFAVFFNLPLSALTILIIGGGPAGLAAAIEAVNNGYSVTVVEKRDRYARAQWLFLDNCSMTLLKKWEVNPPQMKSIDIGEGNQIGFVQINHLEEQLEKRIHALGVKKIQGEFRKFHSDRAAVIATASQQEQILEYDFIVGADGANSKIREELNIPKKIWGEAFGASAIILGDLDAKIGISPCIKQGDGSLRRIQVPSASIVFIQFPSEASKETLQKALENQGWIKEAEAVGKGKGLLLTNIAIALSQAQTFSNEQKSAILIGDAAATASFFQGMGANAAFKMAESAGCFFKEEERSKAFQNFNQAIQGTTDALIADSAFLFPLPPK